jgi:hypothetical protein
MNLKINLELELELEEIVDRLFDELENSIDTRRFVERYFIEILTALNKVLQTGKKYDILCFPTTDAFSLNSNQNKLNFNSINQDNLYPEYISTLLLTGEFKVDRFIPMYIGSVLYQFGQQIYRSKIDEKFTIDGYELLTSPFSNLLFPALVMRLNRHDRLETLALNYLPRRSPPKYCRRFITFHN